MARSNGSPVARALIVLVLLALTVPARAQVDMMQAIYAKLADNIRMEYEFHLNQAARQVLASGAPPAKIEKVRKRLQLLSYNKAALMAACIADADKERAADAPPVPLRQNLLVTTCVDIKLKQMQNFSDRAAYADFFFPERIETCGESSRLPELEKVLRPYDFLFLDEPKLYDFARYSECLMKR
jgi:hypothetical protein